MSERDCPDERMVEWIEHKKQMGYYVLTKEERDEWLEEAQRDAYAEGRKDEREEWTARIGPLMRELWQDETLSEQQCSAYLDTDLVSCRRIVQEQA